MKDICGLCGHEMTLDRCGSAAADGKRLCHADDHDCYHDWTVYGKRPSQAVLLAQVADLEARIHLFERRCAELRAWGEAEYRRGRDDGAEVQH